MSTAISKIKGFRKLTDRIRAELKMKSLKLKNSNRKS